MKFIRKRKGWRCIVEYPRYEVNREGDVVSYHNGYRKLKHQRDPQGYHQIALWVNKEQKTFRVHRLVAEAFLVGRTDVKSQVNHINEDKDDNRASNLEWVTSKENANHGTRNIRAGIGHRQPIKIRGIRFSSKTEASICFGVSRSTITNWRESH